MKEVSDVTCLVVDTGLFLPMALRMAEDCKRVLYYNPDHRGFPSLKQGCIGDGFEGVERVNEFWSQIGDIDLVCFPDCQHAGLQEYLESIGKAVWGSRRGIELELGREKFMKFLWEAGLEVPPHTVCVGIDALSDYLRERTDIYVKISRWRGDMETTHWRDWTTDNGWLDWLAVNLGPIKDYIRFLCFDKIDTKLEIGGDGYSVDGGWPRLMLSGTETKDKCYFASVTERDKMPDQIQEIITAVTPRLREYRYRNQISFEDRVLGDKHFWTDATQRAGMPSTASQHKLWKNFATIVWLGANGELVEPEPSAMFSIECMITTKPDAQCWDVVEIPKELEPWVRFSNCAFIDGCFVFPPDEMNAGDLGWLIATGDSPREVLDRAKELADMLPDGLNADVESMVDLIKELEVAEKEGIRLSTEPMPTVEEVVSD